MTVRFRLFAEEISFSVHDRPGYPSQRPVCRAAALATLYALAVVDRVPKSGVTGGGTPRSPARAGLVSWR
jgi:hypothetical protein